MINVKTASGTDLSHPTPKPNIKKGPKLTLRIENKLAFLGVGVKGLLMALVVVGWCDLTGQRLVADGHSRLVNHATA
jgi:hypothetical protein